MSLSCESNKPRFVLPHLVSRMSSSSDRRVNPLHGPFRSTATSHRWACTFPNARMGGIFEPARCSDRATPSTKSLIFAPGRPATRVSSNTTSANVCAQQWLFDGEELAAENLGDLTSIGRRDSGGVSQALHVSPAARLSAQRWTNFVWQPTVFGSKRKPLVV